MGTRLDHRPCLGEVLTGLGYGTIEGGACFIQAAGSLGDGLDQDVGLVKAFLSSAHSNCCHAALASRQLLLCRGCCVLDERQAFLGLQNVVGDLGQRGFSVLGTEAVERLLGVGDLGVGFLRPGRHCCQGLRRVFFQFAQGVEISLLVTQGRQGCFGTTDDLAEPAALLFFSVRDVVVQLLLKLEGLRHVALGLFQGLGEVANRGVTVLRLRKAQLLFAGADGVVCFDQQRAALLTQFRDTEARERVKLFALRSVAGADGFGAALLTPVSEIQVGSRAAGSYNTDSDKGADASVSARNSPAASACGITNGGCSIDRGLGKVFLTPCEIGGHRVLRDVGLFGGN
ncbi:hypothetical protein PJL18_03928 [Paenarthrobacter nicotinovorans]|nr:hypothetical protein [Paenarthrobacter nicotinovorans]